MIKMKKVFVILLVFVSFFANAQKKKTTTKRIKDTIKTEVVQVVTSYTPKVSDATKIKKQPKITLSKKNGKKELSYRIFSVPVASTFIPKSGVVKGIDVGKKERLYNNYLSGGFGNNTTPFFELFLRHSAKFDNEFGLFSNYISSSNGVKNTLLNSDFSKFTLGLFYYQKERFFDWKIGLQSDRKSYNWYGLPNLPFTPSTILAINETQIYDLFKVHGELIFEDSFINTISTSISYFKDAVKSKESLILLQPKFNFPLRRFSRNLNDLNINAKLEFLKGEFVRDYPNQGSVSYSIITTSTNPVYRMNWRDFDIKMGTKLFFSADTQNKRYDFFIYPDVHISYPVLKDYVTMFVGSSGDLYTNSYQNLTDKNPYISPTQFITQTNEKYSFYGGFSGKISKNVAFNIKGSYKNEEDKPLFVRNNSKSNGTFSSIAGVDLTGYEYGNSFSVFYDDVQTITGFAELEIDISKRTSIGVHFQYDAFTLRNQQEAWNLPTVQGAFFGKYKNDKFFINTNIFYVGERKGLLYSGTFPSTTNGIQILDSYVDVNLSGGYHFNDQFSAFVKLNNVLGNEYQRFSHFTVQGFQALAGVTWKFDF